MAGNNEGYRTVLRGPGAVSLIDPTDRRAFSDCLHRLSRNPRARRQWQSWAQKAITRYDKKVVANQYEACFKAAVQAKAGAKR